MFDSFLFWALFAIVGLIYAIGVGFATRSLMSAPVGWPRTYVVGLLVYAASWPFAASTAAQAGVVDAAGDLAVPWLVAALFIALSFGWVFAFGVAILVVSEALFPTQALPNPITSFRDLMHRRRRTQRYLEILSILSRHGIGWVIQGRRRSAARNPVRPQRTSTPQALVNALNDAGVTFVKLGQVLATRRDLLPAPYIEALATLQTSASTLPWESIRHVIETELGAPIHSVFAEVSETPLAAASVAQVHAGRLHDGTPVVLKVQRPGAAAQVAADVDIIVRLATRLEDRTSWGRDFGAVTLATGFARSLSEELDYRIEFRNTKQVRSAVAASRDNLLIVPQVYDEASTRRLLTMDRIDGTPLNASQRHLASLPPAQREELAAGLLDAVLEQIVVQGVFHADLHPGNLVLGDDGRLGMIDFGAVGVLERSMREGLATLLVAAASEDDIATTDALLLLVEAPDGADLSALRADIGRVLTLMKHSDGSSSIFSQLLDVVREHRLGVPVPLGIAFRSIITLQSCLRILDPRFDMAERALDRVPHFLGRLLAPRAVIGSLEAQAAILVATARRLPRRLDSLTTDVEKTVRALAGPQDHGWVGEIVTESVGALIAIALVALGIVLVVADAGPLITPNVHLYSFLGASVALAGFVLILRSLRRLFVRKPR
ncbi:AarF/UbiB family protein [Leifsonia sp. YIM 134122]|uniref:AarF/UbiB family protein n=1 Tax=Leifsonia stereocauli TaxID=3134136 RepID=A0ABU9W2L2_9MICO